MSATQRRRDCGVALQLLQAPHRFEFFQALRVLEHVFKRGAAGRGQSIAQHLRFRNSLDQGFPASELSASTVVRSADGTSLEGGAALETALQTGTLGCIEMTPLFMGLLGTSGALPLHYTETLQQRELYARDHAARAFLDIFSTRAVSLHYAAWKKNRIAIQYEIDGRERFLPLVLALAGLGQHGLRERLHDGYGDVFDESVAYYAGLIRHRPVSAGLVQRLLTDYFKVPIEVEQFVGAWYRLPAGQRSCLGLSCAQLGVSAMAGTRVWQRSLRLRLRVGPLPRHRFDAFLPGGDAALALTRWLGLLTGSSLEYEVRLILYAADLPESGLGVEHVARLGWDSYVASGGEQQDRDETRYEIEVI